MEQSTRRKRVERQREQPIRSKPDEKQGVDQADRIEAGGHS
ncbi:MAG: hypothetical protein NTV52_11965 [Acidobacteria bacterium]|nr:hypothetical protein [Acidobacteriota bacterium]